MTELQPKTMKLKSALELSYAEGGDPRGLPLLMGAWTGDQGTEDSQARCLSGSLKARPGSRPALSFFC
jgi:hypothetical protein